MRNNNHTQGPRFLSKLHWDQRCPEAGWKVGVEVRRILSKPESNQTFIIYLRYYTEAQRWRAVGDTVSDLTRREPNPTLPAPISMCLTELTGRLTGARLEIILN